MDDLHNSVTACRVSGRGSPNILRTRNVTGRVAVAQLTGYASAFKAESGERLRLALAAAYWLLAPPHFLVRAVARVLIFIALFAVLAPVRVSRVSFAYLVAVGRWWLQPDASASRPHDQGSYRMSAIARLAGGAIVTLGALAIPIALAIAALPLLLDAHNTSQARNHGNAGLVLYHEGQLRDAIEEFDQAIHLNPQLASAYVARAAAYGDLGDTLFAWADANTAIELDPTLAGAYVNRARAYMLLSDYPAALDDANTAIDLDPNLAEAYLQRANAHSSLGDYQDALDDSHRALELNPDLVTAHVIRGQAYSALGDPDPAVNDWQTALSLTDDPASITQIESLIKNITATQ